MEKGCSETIVDKWLPKFFYSLYPQNNTIIEYGLTKFIVNSINIYIFKYIYYENIFYN